MSDDLGMSRQEDGNGCDCYCLSAMRRFEKIISGFPYIHLDVYGEEAMERTRDVYVSRLQRKALLYLQEHQKFDLTAILRRITTTKPRTSRNG